MTPTPLCHLSLSVGYGHKSEEYLLGAPCIGSRCSAWVVLEGELGRCGLSLGSQRFPDPARQTTRQTTRKPA